MDQRTLEQRSLLNGDLVLIKEPPDERGIIPDDRPHLATPRIVPLHHYYVDDGEQCIYVQDYFSSRTNKVMPDKKIAELDPDQSVYVHDLIMIERHHEDDVVMRREDDAGLYYEVVYVYRSIGKLSESKAYQLAMQRWPKAIEDKQRAKEEKAATKKAAKSFMAWADNKPTKKPAANE
jgi:hypothetical protein